MTHYPGMTLKKEEYYEPKDLICGSNMNIFSKHCLLFNCDEFTKHWYMANLGIDQTQAQLKSEKIKRFYQ